MTGRRISQEVLKVIACVTMLIDHIGAALWPVTELRIIGRLAFPIYCFLLAEGSHYTKKPGRYGLRLLIGMLLSEAPFDLLFYGRLTWRHQSVMVTLLLGFCALEVMKRCPHLPVKALAALLFAGLADWARSDYGAEGVLLVVLFAVTRGMSHGWLLQLLGMWFLFSPDNAMMLGWIGGFSWSIQEWALLAMIPIGLYSGQKLTKNKWMQWAFYLFYPVHMGILLLIRGL